MNRKNFSVATVAIVLNQTWINGSPEEIADAGRLTAHLDCRSVPSTDERVVAGELAGVQDTLSSQLNEHTLATLRFPHTLGSGDVETWLREVECKLGRSTLEIDGAVR
ncbi:MAG TPA: hypothetical protein VFZ48_00630 [Candidatus Saccharimonadales bacterium]